MNDFQTNFLKEYIQPLRQLRQTLSANFSETNRREAFRQIHSLKGCVQTFGLKNCAVLTESLETLLANPKIVFLTSIQEQLLAGLKGLETELEGESSQGANVFIENFRYIADSETSRFRLLFTRLAVKIFEQFSGTEKINFLDSLERGKQIFILRKVFAPTDFSRDFQILRKVLSESGEIIAIIPESNDPLTTGIGMQIVLAHSQTASFISEKTIDYSPQIETFTLQPDFSDDLPVMLRQIAEHFRKVSAKQKKQIDLTILANPEGFRAQWTKPLFEIILHLTRNALDHGLERTGTLEILVFAQADGLYLSVTDDGHGIDPAKVSRHAIEQNLLAPDAKPDPRKTLELIFAPELSTALKVTETSGRGIGLDAVKTTVEKLNGKISVKSRKDKGTRFDVFIPPPNSDL